MTSQADARHSLRDKCAHNLGRSERLSLTSSQKQLFTWKENSTLEKVVKHNGSTPDFTMPASSQKEIETNQDSEEDGPQNGLSSHY